MPIVDDIALSLHAEQTWQSDAAAVPAHLQLPLRRRRRMGEQRPAVDERREQRRQPARLPRRGRQLAQHRRQQLAERQQPAAVAGLRADWGWGQGFNGYKICMRPEVWARASIMLAFLHSGQHDSRLG